MNPPVERPEDAPRGLFRPGATARLLSPRVLFVFRIALTVVTLAMVVWYLRSRPAMDFSGFRLAWGPLLPALLLTPLILVLRAAKWQMLARGLAPRITLRESFRSYLGSTSLAVATPGRVGELSRGLYLPHVSIQGWKGAGLVLVDSWTDFMAVALWACIGFALVAGRTGLAGGLLLFVLVAPVPAWIRLVPHVLSRLPSRWGFRAWAARALPSPGDIPNGDMLKASLLGILAYGFEFLQACWLLEGIAAVEPSPWRLAGLLALVALANSIQVTMAGFGVREGMAILLLAQDGIGPEAAAAAAFLQSALLLLLPALVGLMVKPVARNPGDAPTGKAGSDETVSAAPGGQNPA
jgi:uncharacterized membrane protein YbhN (UPF0104 family)